MTLIGDPKDLFYSPIRTTDFSWNFEKILIDHKGHPRKRYTPSFKPLDMKNDIKQLVDECLLGKKDQATFKDVFDDVV